MQWVTSGNQEGCNLLVGILKSANAILQVHAALGGADLPLLWTVDFIVDTDTDGSDIWRIGEINCRRAPEAQRPLLCPDNPQIPKMYFN